MTPCSGRATNRAGVDVEGFKLGRTPAVTASIAGLVEDLWLLTRRGFVTTIDVRMLVRGIPRLSTAETLVVSILSEVCQPASRAEIDGPEALRRRALTAARAQLVAHADAHGGLAPLTDELHAEGVDDLDQLIGGEAAELIAPTSIAPGLDDEHAAARAETAAFVEGLVDADQAVAEHRLAGGQSAREVAKRLDCGVVAVQARERRLRRRLRSRLRKAGETTSDLGDAALDALWSNQPGQLTPPPLTVERVTRSVATRMHPEEPAPFAQRAAWAAGATAIALGAWLLMFTGVLPYYGDDTHPEPQLIVRCNPVAPNAPSSRCSRPGPPVTSAW